MNESGGEMAAESGDETLTRLGDALGQPPPSMVENAKALFAFFAHEDACDDNSVPAGSTSVSASASAGDRVRH